MQERLGVEIMSLIDDPSSATARSIAQEAHARLQTRSPAGHARSDQPTLAAAKAVGPSWIAPAPVQIKMRLFCLPYAGGVSENVFGR